MIYSTTEQIEIIELKPRNTYHGSVDYFEDERREKWGIYVSFESGESRKLVSQIVQSCPPDLTMAYHFDFFYVR